MGYQEHATGTPDSGRRCPSSKIVVPRFLEINSTPRIPRDPKNFSRLVNVLPFEATQQKRNTCVSITSVRACV
jgi:hypothetical protein